MSTEGTGFYKGFKIQPDAAESGFSLDNLPAIAYNRDRPMAAAKGATPARTFSGQIAIDIIRS